MPGFTAAVKGIRYLATCIPSRSTHSPHWQAVLVLCCTKPLLHCDAEARSVMQTKLLEDSRPQDGYGTSGQPSGALLTWPYQPKNGLYYERDAVALTEKELSLQVQVSISPHAIMKAAHAVVSSHLHWQAA